MINDVLFEAVQEMDCYLHSALFAGAYSGDLRAQVLQLRDAMESMRVTLEMPPRHDTV